MSFISLAEVKQKCGRSRSKSIVPLDFIARIHPGILVQKSGAVLPLYVGEYEYISARLREQSVLIAVPLQHQAESAVTEPEQTRDVAANDNCSGATGGCSTAQV